ncbi:MAG TPA: O-antigen ligase family protein [Candidatus Eisenbacteria bacterium]|nr:O-antigen ligase family protein [Candidatus Eisenbacteria bacterium]
MGVEVMLLIGGIWANQILLAVGAVAAVFYGLLAIRFPELACVLLWIVVPLSLERPVTGGIAAFLPSEPMLVLLVSGWVIRSLWLGQAPRLPRDVALPLLAFAGVALASTLLGAHPGVGIKALLITGMYATLGLLVFPSLGCAAERRARWAALAATTGAVAGAYGAIRVLGGEGNISYGVARPFFAEHGTYAAYLGFLLPLTVLLALESRGRARFGYSVAAAAQVSGLALSFTRAAWLSILVVLPPALLAWYLWRRSARPIGVLFVAIALVAGIVLSPRTWVGSQLGQRAATITDSQNVSNLERVNRWVAGAEMIKAHPLLGVGYNGYIAEYRRYRRPLIWTPQIFAPMGSHSEPLQWLCETGILGFGAAVWFFAAVVRRGLRTFRSARSDRVRVLALGVIGGLATYAVHGLFNAYQVDKVSVPLWLGVGALVALSADRGVDPASDL